MLELNTHCLQDDNVIINRFLLALSGGLDSIVLLHLATTLEFPIIAIHVNHHLSANADQWQAHCEKICTQLHIPLLIEHCQIDKVKGASSEALARTARYQAINKHLSIHDCLLTAHHQDDQAETVLYRLIRGSGIKGLGAIREFSKYELGYVWRPLLNFQRQEILAFAKMHKLSWVEDESNLNRDFDRNFLRHDILPQLKQRWPSTIANIMRTASHCQQADIFMAEVAEQDLQTCLGERPNTLSASKLKRLSSRRRNNLVRYWLQANNFTLPSRVKMQHIEKDIIFSSYDATPLVHWGKVEVRRFRDDIYVLTQQEEFDSTVSVAWPDLTCPLQLPGDLGILQASPQAGGIRLNSGQISVRFRQGGEVISAANNKHKTLKKLFAKWNIPPWQRQRIPLLFCDEECVAVIGYACAEDYKASADELAWHINIK